MDTIIISLLISFVSLKIKRKIIGKKIQNCSSTPKDHKCSKIFNSSAAAKYPPINQKWKFAKNVAENKALSENKFRSFFVRRITEIILVQINKKNVAGRILFTLLK